MVEDEKSGSWWLTMPGILTGIAAIVTAVAGLVGILYQNGVLDGQRKSTLGSDRPKTQLVGAASSSNDATHPTRTESPSALGTGNNTTNADSNTPPKDSLKTWAETEAIITAK